MHHDRGYNERVRQIQLQGAEEIARNQACHNGEVRRLRMERLLRQIESENQRIRDLEAQSARHDERLKATRFAATVREGTQKSIEQAEERITKLRAELEQFSD